MLAIRGTDALAVDAAVARFGCGGELVVKLWFQRPKRFHSSRGSKLISILNSSLKRSLSLSHPNLTLLNSMSTVVGLSSGTVPLPWPAGKK